MCFLNISVDTCLLFSDKTLIITINNWKTTRSNIFSPIYLLECASIFDDLSQTARKISTSLYQHKCGGKGAIATLTWHLAKVCHNLLIHSDHIIFSEKVFLFSKPYSNFQRSISNNKQKGIDHSAQPGRKVSEDQKGVYQNFQNCGRQTDRNIYVGSCFLVNK